MRSAPSASPTRIPKPRVWPGACTRGAPCRAQASSGVSAALSTGRSQLIPDVPAWLAGQATPDEELLTLSRVLGVRSSIVAPLAHRGRVFGALTLATAQSGRQYSEEDLAVAEDLARRAALAIENARLYSAEHDIAHALQQFLLPGTLTQPAGAEIAASYRPAGEGAEVGGDFYDTWQHDDVHFLAIGDVAGHGPPAAALTSLTRQAMRVVSLYEPSPGRVLAVVNDTIRAQTAPEQFCTAALASLRPVEGGYLLTVACAGHPPPVIVRAANGEPEEIGTCGALLGVVAEREYEDRECLLGLGDLVAFWTDGVTERRHSGDMFGEQRLLSLLAGAANRSAADVAREIDEAVMEFAPGLPHDDVAIMVARVTAVVGERAATGRPPPDVAVHMTEVRELRLVVTADDYDEALRFYRDVLGLRERAAYSSPGGRVVILEAGSATLELTDPPHAAFIDEVEVGRRVAGHIRVAFEVDDSRAVTSELAAAGATVIAEATVTPWNSLNARLEAPAGLQLTLFTELGPDDG